MISTDVKSSFDELLNVAFLLSTTNNTQDNEMDLDKFFFFGCPVDLQFV